MLGVLNINKPQGWSSRDVVNRVHRFVRPERAGHAGTLDPLATGVLVVAVGQATRLVQFAHRLPKTYRATFLLGQRSATDDIDGVVEAVAGATVPSRADLEAAVPAFVGDILQEPPAYSAISIRGQRSYKLARRGEVVALTPRVVTVHRLVVLGYDYPTLELEICCGSGTYVRALGRDLAERLGTAGVMSALERTHVGSLVVGEAVGVGEVESAVERLLPARLLVDALPSATLTGDQIGKLHQGLRVELDPNLVRAPIWPPLAAAPEIACFDAVGRVVSIVQAAEAGLFRPVCNFLSSD